MGLLLSGSQNIDINTKKQEGKPMAVTFSKYICSVFLAISLASCATSDPSDDFSYDFSSAKIADFNGFWEGRIDCKYANGFKPTAWVRLRDGRGEFGFGKQTYGFGSTSLGSLYDDFDAQDGEISWRGELLPWRNTKDKLSVSFSGNWRDSKFKIKGRIAKKSCSGLLRKI